MASITYKKDGSNSTSREEIEKIAEHVKEQMFFGGSVMSAGGTHCYFYYGSSCVGLANIMSWRRDDLAVRLVAPDKFRLKEFTEVLGAPYNEKVLEGIV